MNRRGEGEICLRFKRHFRDAVFMAERWIPSVSARARVFLWVNND